MSAGLWGHFLKESHVFAEDLPSSEHSATNSEDYWQQKDASLLVIPPGSAEWRAAVDAFAESMVRHELRDTVVFRGRAVAIRAGLRRLHRRGARHIGILYLAAGPCGIPFVHSQREICPCCLSKLMLDASVDGQQ